MIAACPKCNARYRVDEAKIGPEGARLRCARCQAVFRLRVPAAAARRPVEVASSEAAPLAGAPPAPQPQVSLGQVNQAPSPQVAESPPAEPEYDRERLVLVADPNEETGKQTASALASWGLQTILVHDGVEAMLSIQRALPRVVILDAALPKMYGFQVCEVMKRNESLCDTRVILVGAIHHHGRYRRPPSDLYGADIYLERPDLPDGLASLLVQFGMSLSPGTAASVDTPARPAKPAAPAATPVVEQPAAFDSPTLERPTLIEVPPPADDGLAEERAKAERLARIVVSDIVLYQAERFDAAVRAGTLLETLDAEIEEGRSFFRQRINERVRNERDYLTEELTRVARERGMQ